MVRAGWWAHRASRAARRAISSSAWRSPGLPAPPPVAANAEPAVHLVLRVRRENCFVRALVRKAWLLAHGDDRSLVIGVKPPSQGFEAHAWLEGDPAESHAGFSELYRY